MASLQLPFQYLINYFILCIKRQKHNKTSDQTPPILMRTRTENTLVSRRSEGLTHSTSLTKPSGSLSGDRFSRNPVIMVLGGNRTCALFLCSDPKGSGRMKRPDRNDVVAG